MQKFNDYGDLLNHYIKDQLIQEILHLSIPQIAPIFYLTYHQIIILNNLFQVGIL